MKMIDLMKKAFARADYSVKGAAVEARPAPRAYSRWNRSPINADKALRPGDVVLPSGQVVAPDAPPPPGERLAGGGFDAVAPFEAEYGPNGGHAFEGDIRAAQDAWDNGGAVEFMRRRAERIQR